MFSDPVFFISSFLVSQTLSFILFVVPPFPPSDDRLLLLGILSPWHSFMVPPHPNTPVFGLGSCNPVFYDLFFLVPPVLYSMITFLVPPILSSTISFLVPQILSSMISFFVPPILSTMIPFLVPPIQCSVACWYLQSSLL
jgi:hypothetical protein